MKVYITLLALLFLAGCSQKRQRIDYHNSLLTKEALVKNAKEIKHSYDELLKIEATKHLKHKQKDLKKFNHPLLEKRASIDWNGPAQKIIKQIASIGGFEFRTLGAKPSMPIIVNLNSINIPLSYLLKDLNYQIAKYATINIDASEKVIELIYEN